LLYYFRFLAERKN